MTRASACGSSWLSVESRRVALATIATPSRADAPRRRPVAAVRHATAAEAPATHWAGRQKARAALASATRLMSESDRASFAAYDVEFVVEISRCRAPLHRSTTHAVRHAADVELYSSTALQSALHLYSSTALYTLHPLHPPSGCHEDRRPRRRWTDANSLSDSHSRLSYWSYRKSAVREPPARRRRERCHEGSRWRPSPGSLAQPTTLRDRRPIVMSLSRTGAPLEVMFIDSKALLIAKGGKGTLDPHACNPRATAHHCSARDTVAGPTPIAIHRRT